MKTLGLVVLMVLFCLPAWASECGIADSPQELGRVGHHMQYAMNKIKDAGGRSFWGVIAWCPTVDGKFKWAYEAYCRSSDSGKEMVKYRMDSCPGNCRSAVQYITRNSREL